MKRVFLRVLAVALAVLAAGACGGSDRGGQMTGRGAVLLTMPVPAADRAVLLANRAMLEDRGLVLAPDASQVTFPELAPGGWLVRFGEARAFADAQGVFVIDVGDGTGSGGIYHPSHENEVPVIPFTAADLVRAGGTPPALVVDLPFDGPCQMSVGPDNHAHCGGAAAHAGHGRLDATYPPDPREQNCEILDGWIDSNDSALGAYFGSTCFDRVMAGACPNEGGFGIFDATICCFKNHRGRFCQELQPGDIELLDLETTSNVFLDLEVEFTVHNNETWGDTFIITWGDKGIGGVIPAESTWFDGEGGTIEHYDRARVEAWECGTPVSQGADIYVADRVIRYQPPRCLDEPPPADASDAYRISSRDGRANFTVTFQLQQSLLYTFDGGPVFDISSATARGSILSEPDDGCTSTHIHGTHPCTDAADPDPTGCGHGAVSRL